MSPALASLASSRAEAGTTCAAGRSSRQACHVEPAAALLPAAAAPKPASLALFGTALAGFATLRRRRRTARQTNAPRAMSNAA